MRVFIWVILLVLLPAHLLCQVLIRDVHKIYNRSLVYVHCKVWVLKHVKESVEGEVSHLDVSDDGSRSQ